MLHNLPEKIWGTDEQRNRGMFNFEISLFFCLGTGSRGGGNKTKAARLGRLFKQKNRETDEYPTFRLSS
ncbi:MAG TPA: hypothetical protein DHW64_07830 [Chitinophagaceae bacterium]|nr:hypothetical protein [Chitinophagaceae bacterium]